jgi:hypothetical protein
MKGVIMNWERFWGLVADIRMYGGILAYAWRSIWKMPAEHMPLANYMAACTLYIIITRK